MSSSAIVWSPDGVLDDLDEGAFIEAIKGQWPSARIIAAKPHIGLCLTAQVEDGDPPGWQIFYLGDGQLSSDGNFDEQLRFAAWAARLLPEGDNRRLLLFDGGVSVAAYLKPGMTPDEIKDAWNQEPPV